MELRLHACLSPDRLLACGRARPQGMDQAKRAEAALQQLEQGPLLTAKKLGSLAALSALYRDMHLAAQSIDARLRGSANPLYDEPPTSMAAKGKGGSGAAAPGETAAPAFPTLDTTTLPDTEVLSGMRLEQKHMDKISAWVALQPNHIETSHTLLTGINLFPPQEATYPTYVDFDAVVKGLEKHKSRSRLRQLRRLKLRQDKFQLATWNHHSGH
eukprot:365273-Chlamydomonas_euryale.AAC.9